jgi:hypothetical protein
MTQLASHIDDRMGGTATVVDVRAWRWQWAWLSADATRSS